MEVISAWEQIYSYGAVRYVLSQNPNYLYASGDGRDSTVELLQEWNQRYQDVDIEDMDVVHRIDEGNGYRKCMEEDQFETRIGIDREFDEAVEIKDGTFVSLVYSFRGMLQRMDYAGWTRANKVDTLYQTMKKQYGEQLDKYWFYAQVACIDVGEYKWLREVYEQFQREATDRFSATRLLNAMKPDTTFEREYRPSFAMWRHKVDTIQELLEMCDDYEVEEKERISHVELAITHSLGYGRVRPVWKSRVLQVDIGSTGANEWLMGVYAKWKSEMVQLATSRLDGSTTFPSHEVNGIDVTNIQFLVHCVRPESTARRADDYDKVVHALGVIYGVANLNVYVTHIQLDTLGGDPGVRDALIRYRDRKSRVVADVDSEFVFPSYDFGACFTLTAKFRHPLYHMDPYGVMVTSNSLGDVVAHLGEHRAEHWIRNEFHTRFATKRKEFFKALRKLTRDGVDDEWLWSVLKPWRDELLLVALLRGKKKLKSGQLLTDAGVKKHQELNACLPGWKRLLDRISLQRLADSPLKEWCVQLRLKERMARQQAMLTVPSPRKRSSPSAEESSAKRHDSRQTETGIFGISHAFPRPSTNHPTARNIYELVQSMGGVSPAVIEELKTIYEDVDEVLLRMHVARCPFSVYNKPKGAPAIHAAWKQTLTDYQAQLRKATPVRAFARLNVNNE